MRIIIHLRKRIANLSSIWALKWIILLIFFLLLSACTNTAQPKQNANEEKFSVIHTSTAYQQDTSNKVKAYIERNEAFNEVYAVNSDSQILIAVIPEHQERFQLKDFRKELEKELKDEIQPIKLELSTDRKIALELGKLEEKLKNNTLSKKELHKELERIIKLSKEQT